MKENPTQNPQLGQNGGDMGSGYARRPKDRLPPELTLLEKCVFWIVVSVFILTFLFFIFLCWAVIFAPKFIPSCTCWAYMALALVLASLSLDRYIRHNKTVYEARLEDRSAVEALFVEAQTVEPRLNDPERPRNYSTKKEELEVEVKRLKKLGPEGWTEFQVLSLNQMVVDFLKIGELKARAHSNLATLKEYADDSSYRYDTEFYGYWFDRIQDAETILDKPDGSGTDKASNSSLDDLAERLRAELRTLLEHVADYQEKWAEGSAIVRDLITIASVSIPILLIMGVLPIWYPSHNGILGFYNWSFVGISGSLTAVLMGLRKSDLLEVGNTEGKKEFWRAVTGAILGLVAATVLYLSIMGELVQTGHAVPNLDSSNPKDIGLSILWAFGAGFSFERIFEKWRNPAEGKG